MKRKIFEIFRLVIVVSLVITYISNATMMHTFAKEESNTDLSIAQSVHYDTEQFKATISLSREHIEDSQLEVVEIVAPDQSRLDLDYLGYDVYENGVYEFEVGYVDHASESHELQTQKILVEVDGIKSVENKIQEEVPTSDENQLIAPAALNLGNNQFIVYSIAELKQYAAIPNAKIYLGRDLFWESGTAHSKRIIMADGVTINGTDPTTGIRHFYSYHTGASSYESFQIGKDYISVRFEDIDFYGVGEHGVASGHSYVNVTQTFHNVNFTSESAVIADMPYGGKLVFSGESNLNLTKGGAYAEEFAFVTELEFAEESKVTINHDSKGNWHHQSFLDFDKSRYQTGIINVRKNADVKIKTTKSFVHTESHSKASIDLVVETGAKFVLDQTNNKDNRAQFSCEHYETPTNIYVKRGGSFTHLSNTSEKYAMLNLYGSSVVQVGEDAEFILKNYGQGPAVSSNSGGTFINIDEAKYAEFTAQKANPIAMTTRSDGNLKVKNQFVHISSNGANYEDLGYVNNIVMNHQKSSSSILSVNPNNWGGLAKYNSGRHAMKSIVFKGASIEQKVEIIAKNAFIKQNDAKNLNAEVDLIPYNQAKVLLLNGTEAVPSVSVGDFKKIQAGILGTYPVTYSYTYEGKVISKNVFITVHDGSVSPDGDFVLNAKDGTLTQTQAIALSSSNDLIPYNEASVTLDDGTTAIPSVATTSWLAIKAGTPGIYDVTYSYGVGTNYLEKKVQLEVKTDTAHTVNAQDALIHVTQAKLLTIKEDLIEVNKASVITNVGGSAIPNVVVNTSDWTKIIAGEKGTYFITYNYGSGTTFHEKVVKLIVTDGVMPPDGSFALHAKNGAISQSEAKALLKPSDLKVANEAIVTLKNGVIVDPVTSVLPTDWLLIKTGIIGTYHVLYSYGSAPNDVQIPVLITVYQDGGVISPNKDFILNAKDTIINQSEAKALLNETGLVDYHDGSVVMIDGTGTKVPTASAADFAKVKAGNIGTYHVVFQHGVGLNTTSKTVKLNVVKDGSVIAKDRTMSIYAENYSVTQTNAKKIVNKEELIGATMAEVTLSNGTKTVPTIDISTGDFIAIQSGKAAKYNVSFTYLNLDKEIEVIVVAEYYEQHLFDYNDDKIINIQDFVEFIRIYNTGGANASQKDFLLSDSNGDGLINGLDLLEIRSYMSNQSKKPPLIQIPI